MKEGTVSIIKLEPDTGKTLTNGKTYSKKVYLGRNDSPENWYEIPDAEVPRDLWADLGINIKEDTDEEKEG